MELGKTTERALFSYDYSMSESFVSSKRLNIPKHKHWAETSTCSNTYYLLKSFTSLGLSFSTYKMGL